jgi:hypothetical protein
MFAVTAPQASPVALASAQLTSMTRDWTGKSFLPVDSISKAEKSKSLRFQPRQHFTEVFFFYGCGQKK